MRKRAASRAKPAQPAPTTAVALAISPNLDALLRFDDSLRRRRPQTAPCEIEIEHAWRESLPPAPSPSASPPLPSPGGLPPPPRGPRRPRSRTVGQKLVVAGNARDGARDGASTVRGARSSAHLRGLGRYPYGPADREAEQEEREGEEKLENPYINRAPALPPFVAEVWRAAVLTGSKPASAEAVGEVEAEAEARAGRGSGSLEGDVASRSRDAIFCREASRSRDAVLSREASRSRDASRPRSTNSRDAHRSSNDTDGRSSVDTVTSPSSSLHASSRPASPKRSDAKDGKLGGASPCGRARPLQKLFAKVRLPSVHHKHTAHAHDDESEAMQALWAELGRRDAAGSGTTSAASSQRGRE